VSDPENLNPAPGAADGTPDGLLADLESGIEELVVDALDKGDTEGARALINDLHYTDIADLLERVDDDQRAQLVEVIRHEFDAEILPDLDDAVRDEVIELLGIEDVAAAMVELDSDDAVEVLEELDAHDQKRVLDAIPENERAILQEGLSYPEDSAGRLMQRELVTVPTFWTIGDTIDFMRTNADSEDNPLPDQFYVLYVVDPSHKPVGRVGLDQVLRTKRPVKLEDIMATDLKTVPATADQEDVAFLFRQRDLVSAPVVDDSGRLVGAITIDDIVDVIDEEHEEDIMRMGGVREHDLYDAVIDTARSRFSWLVINLLTAIVASVVIGLFDATIEEMVALAILMPIVASMGGNAGTQTLTVAVRSIAMKEITATNASRLIGKELMVGVFNGLVFAVLAGAVTWGWFGNPLLGVVVGMAMIVNMIVAGAAGTVIPIVLDRMDVDPAVASGVFLTTITDVVGFFVFLGLAGLILL